MNCYISKNYKNTTNAGNKAKMDIEFFMEQMKIKNVGLHQTTSRNIVYDFLRTLMSVLVSPFRLHKGDCLVLQYPFKKYFSFLCTMAHLRGASVIVLIHDLGSFRRKAITVEKEMSRLNRTDYIIAHNQHMKHWIEEQGCLRPVGVLQIFDYRSEAQIPTVTQAHSPYRITYAGALSPRKNSFLYQVGKFLKTSRIILYGNGFEQDKAEGKELFVSKGFVKSDELISSVEGDFGLVWDGNAINSCSGNFGEYLKFNNPHKTSLYLRCGLPVIIWDQAALADFIKEQKVGICISSLNDLEHILANISKEEYMEMKDNAIHLSQNLQKGFYTQKTIKEGIRYLSPAN